MESIVPYFTDPHLGLEGLITNDIVGLSWTRIMPGFALQYPEQLSERMPFAFAIAGRDGELTDLVNEWLRIKKQDQTIEHLVKLWVTGVRSEQNKIPRWSIAENVLGWQW